MRELPILENAGVISAEKSVDIRAYYATHTQGGVHWALIAFAILGSLLIGAGIILLFAHNWDDLSRSTRAFLSLCPVSIGAILSVTALLKDGGIARRESAGIFHSLAVGASIALIGQTYHLPSDIPAFLLTWALLVLPLMFLLHSTGAYLIYLALVCGWSGLAQNTYGQAAAFWLLVLPPAASLFHLTRINRDTPESAIRFAGIILTLCISTGIVFERTVPGLWIVAYSALLSGAGLLGLCLYGEREGWNNIPKTFGIIGLVVLAYIFTWTDIWHQIGWGHMRHDWQYRTWGIGFDSGITLAFLGGWIITALRAFRRDSIETLTLAAFPVIATLCFALSSLTEKADLFNALIFNAFMLYLGLMYIVLGCRNIKLRQLNGGMGVASLLLITRFFDSEFNYLTRSLVFIGLGFVFLAVNLIMSRRKKLKEVSA